MWQTMKQLCFTIILPGIPLYEGLNMNDIFTMIYPKLSKKIDFHIIQDFINANYILSLEVKDHQMNGTTHQTNTIYLKGTYLLKFFS